MNEQIINRSGLIKNDIKHFLLSQAHFKRVHTIGCARSGTTMLHYAFIAFKNTTLFDKETNIIHVPGLRDSAKLFASHFYKKGPFYFVTKRGAKWWQQERLELLAKFVLKYKIYIINILRDPRDVLTSRHPMDEIEYYISPESWIKSIHAGEYLQNRLKDYDGFITIKYEDVINKTDEILEMLNKGLDLQLRPEVDTWSHLKDNVDKFATNKHMIPYMHVLRNFDKSTIGKWKENNKKVEYINNLLNNSQYRQQINEFLVQYQY